MKLSNFAKEIQTEDQKDRFRWIVFVDEDEKSLGKIDYVEYLLHPTFPNPRRRIYDRESKFALESSGWGQFTIKAILHFKDGKTETVEHYLDFSEEWPVTSFEKKTYRDLHAQARRKIKGFSPVGGGFYVTGSILHPDLKNQRPVLFLVDTGSSSTVLSLKDALLLNLDLRKLPKRKVIGIGGQHEINLLKNTGITFATKDGSLHRILLPEIGILSQATNEISSDIPSILGRDALKNFDIVFEKDQARLYLQARAGKREIRVNHYPPTLRVSKKPRCFISHNNKDKAFVRELASELVKNGVDVWFDEWKIKPGDSITGSITEGLQKYNNFILILTPHSVSSKWVNWELSIVLHEHNSKRRRGQKKIRIIPALVQDCSIPLWLRDIKYVDFRDDFGKGLEELKGALI